MKNINLNQFNFSGKKSLFGLCMFSKLDNYFQSNYLTFDVRKMIDENLLNITEKKIDTKIDIFIITYVQKWFIFYYKNVI